MGLSFVWQETSDILMLAVGKNFYTDLAGRPNRCKSFLTRNRDVALAEPWEEITALTSTTTQSRVKILATNFNSCPIGRKFNFFNTMYTLMCKDLGMANCAYIAKGHTEEEVISMMFEHGMLAHSEQLQEMMQTMTREELSEMMREKIRREI